MARTPSGRPVVTATKRAEKSLNELVEKGGRRLNLRLSPEANNALKIIVAAEDHSDDTAAINQTLISRSAEIKAKQSEEK